MRTNPILFVAALAAVCLSQARASDRPARDFEDVVMSPDGTHVTSIEHDEPADGVEPIDLLVIRPVVGGPGVTVRLPCGVAPACKPSDPAFSPDGTRIGFILKQPGDDHTYVYEVHPDGSALEQRLAFQGAVGQVRYAPDGTLAVLATAGAHKEIGAVKAGAALSGEVGASADEQRIAILSQGGLRFVSPADLYVYQYDWVPSSDGFIATAAPGNGDNEWWVARLWRFPTEGHGRVIYTPPPKQQIASPIVSPDGQHVAFIGGLMSDFGSTGGDAYSLRLDGKSTPVDLTVSMKASITALTWRCSRDGLTATALKGADAELLTLHIASASPELLWRGPEAINGGIRTDSIACGSGISAAVHQTFSRPPEIEVGSIGSWHDLTDVNHGLGAPVIARSLTWKSDGLTVQGWLLQPAGHANDDNQKMITMVHGGPGSAWTPEYETRHSERWLLDGGYDLLLPNPRGSFGQGEGFTMGNVRDFGHGDLRDILRGVDEAERAAPIDPNALGLMGYSYGGYMTMWAVTQTDRFKAAVAGAGVSDWLSYYGQNGIDEWMIPFFGASVYDDPAVYARSSPIDFIKHVRTPTFEFVGDRDLECPMPQSQEFWHALHTLGVPTEFVVYPGQGHELHDAADVADARRRTLAWFARWLHAPAD